MPTGNKSFCPPVSTSTPPLPLLTTNQDCFCQLTHFIFTTNNIVNVIPINTIVVLIMIIRQVGETKTLLLQAFVLARWNECAAAKKKCPTLMLGLNRASTHHNGPAGHYRERGVSLQKMRWQSLIPGQLCPPSVQTVSLLLLCHCTPSIH